MQEISLLKKMDDMDETDIEEGGRIGANDEMGKIAPHNYS